MTADLAPLWLTLRLAAVVTALLLVLGTPLAWWLARTRSRLAPAVEAVTALPLVLPPTVLGFYLLLVFNPTAPLGSFWVSLTGQTLTFSFAGLVLASLLYSLPFTVQPLQSAFTTLGRAPLEAAASLGAGPLDAFLTVAAPLAIRGYLTAAVLTFAHTLGEFGVVLMVGGNIPGQTRVISIAIYEEVETLDYVSAHLLSGILLALSFLILLALYVLNARDRGRA
ncbi:MAG: molybdate ABC transporter permease subunit [Rhodobacteraceae bacterium]|jgi:molybdate transport system permease protein|uniref:molybdate ABC transporter permease subunit n=1 Tax=Albidovulum sp. TaxID=1872424 RepID=UPI001D5D18B3|nr:molybdate ABC transporter permease subunit [uncultured Defluviimonas sp.]MCB2124158.1 molybdate ABC transporter permease subunit [Paracoccaceae bacterium]MCC0068817.1 molybdate ABC transporter permease subunit [Paracoccaceae bacterium]